MIDDFVADGVQVDYSPFDEISRENDCFQIKTEISNNILQQVKTDFKNDTITDTLHTAWNRQQQAASLKFLLYTINCKYNIGLTHDHHIEHNTVIQVTY